MNTNGVKEAYSRLQQARFSQTPVSDSQTVFENNWPAVMTEVTLCQEPMFRFKGTFEKESNSLGRDSRTG